MQEDTKKSSPKSLHQNYPLISQGSSLHTYKEIENSVLYDGARKQKNVKIGKNIERTDNNPRNYPDSDDGEEINLGEIDEYMDSYYQELKISINKIEVGEITNVAENLDNGGINLSEVDDFLDNYLEELNRLIEHMEIRNMD